MNTDIIQYGLLALVVGGMLWTRLGGKTSGADARKLVAEGAALVDVRSPGEYASGHIEGALNIPVDQIAQRAGEIGPKERPVVLYCRSGARSASAAGTLRSLGFQRVEDIGPMSAW